jgi:hypothetical protein
MFKLCVLATVFRGQIDPQINKKTWLLIGDLLRLKAKRIHATTVIMKIKHRPVKPPIVQLQYCHPSTEFCLLPTDQCHQASYIELVECKRSVNLFWVSNATQDV